MNGNVREFLRSSDCDIPERISLVSPLNRVRLMFSENLLVIDQIQDVIEGVTYLHTRQPPICHGDLKSVGLFKLLLTSPVLSGLDPVKYSGQLILPCSDYRLWIGPN